MSTRSSLRLALLASLACVFPLGGCSDLGTHSLSIAGSEAVQASTGVSSSDGWDITFSTLHVVVHDPALIERTDNKPTFVRENGVTVWNVVSEPAEGEELSTMIRATRYDGAQFRIAPTSATGYDPMPGNVPADVVDTAVDEGWSIHVVGSATSAGTTVQFDWAFETNTFYRCKFEGDDVIELAADGDETTVIEILGEALFRGEVGNADAALVFQPIADADADNDGTVTSDELETAGLLDMVTDLTQELGGIRGAGACPEYVAEEG